jgi:hypothetical protein
VDVVRIAEPRDWNYPFSEALYHDSQVVYHGTCSAFAEQIERVGFQTGGRALPIHLLRRLVELADAASFKPWSHRVVRGLSSSTRLDRPDERAVYFAPNFWFARDYATSIGGETMCNARLLASELLRVLETRSLSGEPEGLEAARIEGMLAEFLKGAFPVVYAVRVEPGWLQHGESSLRRDEFGGSIHLQVNAACLQSVPAECILARAEYVNGAESGYLGPAPSSWAEARHLSSPQKRD